MGHKRRLRRLRAVAVRSYRDPAGGPVLSLDVVPDPGETQGHRLVHYSPNAHPTDASRR